MHAILPKEPLPDSPEGARQSVSDPGGQRVAALRLPRPDRRIAEACPTFAAMDAMPSGFHHVELYVSDLERAIEFWTPFMALLGYEADPWPGGINYVAGESDPYVSILEAPEGHRSAGYHRQRIGLNHLAFRAASREQVDDIREWMKRSGHPLLYDDRYPYATGEGYYAVFCEDPDRIKLEVVAPE